MAKVVIYTTNYCPYCFRAKALLRSKDVEFEEIDVTDDLIAEPKWSDCPAGERCRRSLSTPNPSVVTTMLGGLMRLENWIVYWGTPLNQTESDAGESANSSA